MTENTAKASLSATNTKRGTDKKTAPEAVSDPICDFNRKSEIMQLVEALLPIGSKDPITAHEIAEILGLSDIRCITKGIYDLRREGIPVCASTNPGRPGYYTAEDPDELERYIRSLRHRRVAIQEIEDSMLYALNRMTGQVSLWEEGGNSG